MSARVVSEVGIDGRLVARKRSRDEADAARLAHEADVLAAAQHPGVVELASCERDGAGVSLVTRFVGTHSLETIGPMSVERAAGLVAALAETVADLHDLGIVHGRIEPSHVLIGAAGRPVLCSFAGGGRIGTTPPPGSTAAPGFVDPAATDEAALTPQADVFGLGVLLRALIVDGGSEIEPIPDRRYALARARAPWSGYQRRALLTLADRATDEAPLRRPPARRFAADILDTVPSARLDEDAFAALRLSSDDVEPSRRTRWVTLAAIGIGLVLVILGITGLRGEGSVAAVDEAPSLPSSVTSTNASSSIPAHVENGRIIVFGAQRFEAGVAGDRVAVGDWNCDGVSTPAVLRPSTGAVFVFDAWASDGADVSVSPSHTIVGAVDVLTRDRGDGCSTLVVVRADGTEEEIS
ncbi:MAG: eukaryotic-like serine/threonine-protein kinase [Acidimicrobiaceae bacterium]|jgi:serine/threonine protein kinase